MRGTPCARRALDEVETALCEARPIGVYHIRSGRSEVRMRESRGDLLDRRSCLGELMGRALPETMLRPCRLLFRLAPLVDHVLHEIRGHDPVAHAVVERAVRCERLTREIQVEAKLLGG